MARYIGKEFDRVDGVAKVTGKALYAAEFHVPKTAHAYLVLGEVARGTISSIDTSKASKSPGVVKVFTHLNTPKFATPDVDKQFKALQSPTVYYNAQPIALVVAETFEQAREASYLVRAKYRREEPRTDPLVEVATAYDQPESAGRGRAVNVLGDPDTALSQAEVAIEAEYVIPIEHHNPMEPHAAVAFWTDGKLKIFDKTQGVFTVQRHLAAAFGIPAEDVQVVSPYVGGAFGCSLVPNYYPFLTAMAAKELQRPVKLVYTRRQMYTGHGYRAHALQQVRLGASKDGKLTGIYHQAYNNTSSFEDRSDAATRFTQALYACPNMKTVQKLIRTDMATPCAMRAPGAVTGMFALETALDELAYKLGIDPLQLRLINYAEKDPVSGKPFSSKALRECYLQAAEKIGWSKRDPKPRSMQADGELIGYGMSTGVWFAMQSQASAMIRLKADGSAEVESGASDIGPGTYTVITMIAAEYLGLDIDKVAFGLGDTKMPRSPSQGGSFTTASVGSAVLGAAEAIKARLLAIAQTAPNSPFAALSPENTVLADGCLKRRDDAGVSVTIGDLLKAAGQSSITESFTSTPSKIRDDYTLLAHGAQFVEVRVDEALGRVRVTRAVEATACGRIINPKTSHSQEIGGVVWGIGMALTEATEVDHRYGRIMNPSLASYHIPCCADVEEVITDFVEEDDRVVNPLGVKGMGELGMVGIPAAIGNAIFHATGRRIRELPITPDKILA